MEDAFVLHDEQALPQLFGPGAMLVAGALPVARGRRQISGIATQLWELDRGYLAAPQRVLQARDTSLVLAGHAINVARRGDDGFWRYAISLLDLEQATNER